MNILNVVSTLPHGKEKYDTRSQSAITHIVVHHSATNTGSPMAFAQYHVGLGWPGIGYHYVVTQDGTVYKTQNLTTVSYHAGKANRYSVGICLIGNYDKQVPPAKQIESLLALIGELRAVLKVPVKRVIGHREVPAQKSCPGLAVDMDEIRERLGGVQ
jgi:N-acetylmuramoyl-L-alanine amidase